MCGILAAFFFMFCFVLFDVLLLCFVDSVWHYDNLVEEDGTGYSFLLFFFFFFSASVVCNGLFAVPLGATGRLCSVIVALPEDLLYRFPYFVP